MARKFGSAAAFKTSLEAHLRKRAEERKVPLSTLQLKFVIERLLARLFRNPDPPWLLKGGFAMDLRFRPRARTTKDVDLSVRLVSTDGTEDRMKSLRERLQEASDVDLGDYLTFRDLLTAPAEEGFQERWDGERRVDPTRVVVIAAVSLLPAGRLHRTA